MHILWAVTGFLVVTPLWWHNVSQSLAGVGVPPIVLPIGLVVLALYLYGHLQKRVLILAVPEDAWFAPANADRLQYLDRGKLDAWSVEVESLGFVQQGDFTAASQQWMAASLARIFFHAKERCFCEVYQSRSPAGGTQPLRCTIMTLFDQGWTLATTTAVSNGYTSQLQRSKGIWSSHPLAPPCELLRIHLEKRDQMSAGIHLHPSPIATVDDYCTRVVQDLAEVGSLLRTKYSFAVLVEYVWFRLFPRTGYGRPYDVRNEQ